ncbi:MAG TPA: hypothetical protein VHM26_13185 [Chitinophagaceae bacterium]|nr:hypothetical protein [Chitinophagaceae bacterium]
MKKILLSLIAFSCTAYVMAQARAQADISVTGVTITPVKPGRPNTIANPNPPANLPTGTKPTVAQLSSDVLKCSITVFSHNDDDANQAMLLVVVPVEVSVISNPNNGIVYKAGGGTSPFAGYIIFSLGNMAVGQSKTVEFTFSKSAYGNTVGAYAYSATPDPNPANNYKDASY